MTVRIELGWETPQLWELNALGVHTRCVLLGSETELAMLGCREHESYKASTALRAPAPVCTVSTLSQS